MSRKSILDGGTGSLDALVDEVVYRPTEETRRLKSRFLTRIADNPLIEPAELSLAEAQRIVGGSSLAKYWSQPGFRDWFLNTSEYAEQLDELFHLALGAARDILLNQDPKAQSARASMVGKIAEIAGKMPRKEPKADGASMASAIVGSMDQAQLSVFLQKNGVNMQLDARKGELPASPTIDVDNPPKV